MDWTILYDGWTGPARVALSGLAAYSALVVLLRITGKRTLSDMNAFDFIVTVALGSTLASTILSHDTTVAEGLAALVTLALLQAILAWAGSRSAAAGRAIKSEPTLLVHEGRMLQQAMRSERVSPAEILAAIRAQGGADLRDVHAVVLETNGNFSVVSTPPQAGGATLSTTHPSSLANTDGTAAARGT